MCASGPLPVFETVIGKVGSGDGTLTLQTVGEEADAKADLALFTVLSDGHGIYGDVDFSIVPERYVSDTAASPKLPAAFERYVNSALSCPERVNNIRNIENRIIQEKVSI